MSKKKKMYREMRSFFGNGMPFSPFDWDWDYDCWDSIETYWDQMIDMQRDWMSSSRKQWDQFFEHLMDMEDTFISNLPDEVPNVPGMPALRMSPKAFMKRAKEFQETSNAHFTKQADTMNELAIKNQEKAHEMVTEAVDKAREEKKEEEAEPVKGKPAKAESPKKNN